MHINVYTCMCATYMYKLGHDLKFLVLFKENLYLHMCMCLFPLCKETLDAYTTVGIQPWELNPCW